MEDQCKHNSKKNTKACTNAHKHANTSTALTCQDVPWRLVREDVGKLKSEMNILAADRGFHPPHLDARAKPLVMMPRSPSKLITSEVFQDVVLWGSVGNLSRRIGLIAQSVFAAILSADVFSLMPLGPAKFTSATFRNSSYSRSAYSGGACGLLCHSLLALHPFVISGSSIWI